MEHWSVTQRLRHSVGVLCPVWSTHIPASSNYVDPIYPPHNNSNNNKSCQRFYHYYYYYLMNLQINSDNIQHITCKSFYTHHLYIAVTLPYRNIDVCGSN